MTMKMTHVDHENPFDFGKTSQDYVKYRDIYPTALFERLHKLGVGQKGKSWLDMGTGTGEIPRGMYQYGADITGIDISAEQIEQAKQIAADKGYNIRYVVSSAEKTNFKDNSFDCITACQCFWYFDKKKIVPEIKRLMRPNGFFVKIYMEWDEQDAIARQSQNIVKKINPLWNSGKSALADLKIHCFPNPVTETFSVDLQFTRESWHGRMRACRGVLGSMTSEMVDIFDNEHKQFLQKVQETFTIQHKIYITAYTNKDWH